MIIYSHDFLLKHSQYIKAARPGWFIVIVLIILLSCTAGFCADEVPSVRSLNQEAEVTLLPDGQFFPLLEKAVKEAKREVVICTYLFVTRGKKSNLADHLTAALAEAVSRGIRVKVIMERDRNDLNLTLMNSKTGSLLSRNGIEVIFDDPEIKTHAKLAVIDKRTVFIGSHNLTDSALRFNREMSLLIDSAELAESVLKYMDAIAGTGENYR